VEVERNWGEECPLCVGEEGIKHILVKCLGTRKWQTELLNIKWLKINEEITHKKILICTSNAQIADLGRYLGKAKYKWFNKMEDL
jgi:pimeloyl-CoA synthetase